MDVDKDNPNHRAGYTGGNLTFQNGLRDLRYRPQESYSTAAAADSSYCAEDGDSNRLAHSQTKKKRFVKWMMEGEFSSHERTVTEESS